ncbi:MAG: hypothetical protein ACKVOR_00610 [Flavobacteriales bacterium]
MKKMKIWTAIGATCLMLASCTRESSDSVDQDKIWTKYEIIYDKNVDETTVRVEFRFGGAFGTKLELASPASIKFNNEVIPFNSTMAYYEKTFTALVSSGTFVYSDVDGNVYTNNTSSVEAVEFPPGDIIINGGVDYVMPIVGDAVGSSDIVSMTLSDKIFATSQVGATTITIGGAQTDNITPGPYVATMYRTITQTPASATPEGALIFLTHKALNKAITVND